METGNPKLGVRDGALVALAALLLAGCPTGPSEVWCGNLAVKEAFVIPTAGSPVEQDFPVEARCIPLVSCNEKESVLAFAPDGSCNVRVTPDEYGEFIVLPDSRCETKRRRLGGESREVSFTKGGRVKRTEERFDLDIDWDVVIHPASDSNSRIGATQKWTTQGASLGTPETVDPKLACEPSKPPGGPEDFSSLVGCTEADFVVRTEASAERVVRFGNELGASYAPRCLSIAVGQAVVFEGPFNSYHMAPGLPASISTGAPYNPIGNVFGNTRVEYTFPRAGDFIYSNAPNAARGMTGLIRVR
jgi:plastocyanin